MATQINFTYDSLSSIDVAIKENAGIPGTAYI